LAEVTRARHAAYHMFRDQWRLLEVEDNDDDGRCTADSIAFYVTKSCDEQARLVHGGVACGTDAATAAAAGDDRDARASSSKAH